MQLGQSQFWEIQLVRPPDCQVSASQSLVQTNYNIKKRNRHRQVLSRATCARFSKLELLEKTTFSTFQLDACVREKVTAFTNITINSIFFGEKPNLAVFDHAVQP
jgi:hypothetical protein